MDAIDDANDSTTENVADNNTDNTTDIADSADLMTGDWFDMDGNSNLDYGDPVFDPIPAEQASTVGAKHKAVPEKAVQCTDMTGNVIQVFSSCQVASQKMRISEADIYLCCGKSKPHINGYKFSFVEEPVEEEKKVKLKRGYGLVLDVPKPEAPVQLMRTTRASRGEYALNRAIDESLRASVLAPAKLRARSWQLETVSIGPFAIKKWMPNQPLPSEGLQQHKARVQEGGLSTRKGNRRRSG